MGGSEEDVAGARHRRGQLPVLALVLRLREGQVEGDDRRAALDEEIDETGVERARPRPGADLSEAFLVDRDQHDLRGGPAWPALEEAPVQRHQLEAREQ